MKKSTLKQCPPKLFESELLKSLLLYLEFSAFDG
jgi:hypothetical protein